MYFGEAVEHGTRNAVFSRRATIMRKRCSRPPRAPTWRPYAPASPNARYRAPVKVSNRNAALGFHRSRRAARFLASSFVASSFVLNTPERRTPFRATRVRHSPSETADRRHASPLEAPG